MTMSEEVPFFDGEVEDGDDPLNNDYACVSGNGNVNKNSKRKKCAESVPISPSARRSARLSTKVRRRWSSSLSSEVRILNPMKPAKTVTKPFLEHLNSNNIFGDTQKLLAVREARQNGTMQAAQKYGMTEEQIVQLLTELPKLKAVGMARKEGTIRASQSYNIPEEQVIQWLHESTRNKAVMQVQDIGCVDSIEVELLNQPQIHENQDESKGSGHSSQNGKSDPLRARKNVLESPHAKESVISSVKAETLIETNIPSNPELVLGSDCNVARRVGEKFTCCHKNASEVNDPSKSSRIRPSANDNSDCTRLVTVECPTILESLASGSNKPIDSEISNSLVINLEKSSADCATERSDLQDTLNSIQELPNESNCETNKIGQHYLPWFKEVVLKYAETHTFQHTGKFFKVHHATISGWSNEQQKKQRSSKGKASRSFGPKIVEHKFIAWLRKCRQKNIQIDSQSVRQKCQDLIQTFGAKNVEKHCKWFVMWCKRWDESKATDCGAVKEKHLSYPPALKLEIAAYAEVYNQATASRTFNVARRRIAEWMNSKEGLLNLTETGKLRSKGCGKLPVSLDAEKEILAWYMDCKAKGFRPKTTDIRAKGKEVFKAHGFESHKCSNTWFKRWCVRQNVQFQYEKDDHIIEWVLTQYDMNRTVTHRDLQDYGLSLMTREAPDFKASAGWAIRFCKRHPQLLKSLASVDEPLTAKMEANICKFRQNVQDLQQKHSISLACIGNVDEIPLSFSTTINAAQKKQENRKRCTLLRRPGMENCQAVVIVSCLADGGILPPLIVLKGRPVNPNAGTGQLTVFKEKLLVDSEIILLWLTQVWLRYVPSPNLLIMDCFEPHLSKNVVQHMGQHSVHAAVVPGGCTCKAQPIDIGVKTFFETCIEESWNAYIRTNLSMSANSKSNMQCLPSSDEIISWVSEAYERLHQKQEIVRRTFVVAGLVESLDNSHEHLMENPSWRSGYDSNAEASDSTDSC